MNDNWISNLTIKALRIYREAAGNHRQDMTGPVLENLLSDGYSQVTWNSNGSRHSECRNLNRQVWDLQDFLNTTEYDAPLFSRSHPGDASCTLIVSGEGVPNVEVDSYGDVDHNINAPAPKVPVAPKVKPLAPKPKVQVEEKPIAPKEPKVRYVPEEVHKQIDPFKKQEVVDEITEQDKEDWIKDLNTENVEPTIYPKKELTDEEWDELRNFNVETSQRVPNWIRGIFKK